MNSHSETMYIHSIFDIDFPSMSKKIKIMVAEDHVLYRECLAETLSECKDLRVIGQGGNGKDIIKLVRNVKPDIIISDIEMPEINGYQLASFLNREYPTIKIIFLSMYYSPFYASQAIKSGVSACLPKQCSFEILLEAIRSVYNDGYYFKKDVGITVISDLMAEKTFELFKDQIQLNHREIEILKLICDGKQNREIADLLNLSVATIDFHRQSIYRKTDISSVALLVKYAIKNGITTLNN